VHCCSLGVRVIAVMATLANLSGDRCDGSAAANWAFIESLEMMVLSDAG